MKIALETESCHLLFQQGHMDIFDFIAFSAEQGLDGVQINVVPDYRLDPRWGVLRGDDEEYLVRVREALEHHQLYCDLDARGTTFDELSPVVRVAQLLGADVVRSYVRYPADRFDAAFMASQVTEVQRLLPLLRASNVRLAFENHEYETSAEMIAFVRTVGDLSTVGLLCDVGNAMMAWEEPMEAVAAMAPYSFGVHVKDHAVIQHEGTPYVCGFPLGQGRIDLVEAFRLLVEHGVERVSLETCFPYCTGFKRPVGTGGVLGLRGTFSLVAAPFPSTLVTPLDYYYPSRRGAAALELLVTAQRQELLGSIEAVIALRRSSVPGSG